MSMGAGSQVGCADEACFKFDGLDLVRDIVTQGPTRFIDASGPGFAHLSRVRAPNDMRIASTGTVPEPSSAAAGATGARGRKVRQGC
jgi:hypothetical protein